MASVPDLLIRARDAAKTEALSYRRFHVGAAGKLLVENGISSVHELYAGNLKVAEDVPKFCAEMNIIDQAKQLRGKRHFVGVVIAGTTDRDEIEAVNGVATPTLHPCKECRSDMLESRTFSADTLVLTAGVSSGIAQVHFFGELADLYEDRGSTAALTFEVDTEFDFTNWTEVVEAYDDILAGERQDVSRPLVAKLALETAMIDQP